MTIHTNTYAMSTTGRVHETYASRLGGIYTVCISQPVYAHRGWKFVELKDVTPNDRCTRCFS